MTAAVSTIDASPLAEVTVLRAMHPGIVACTPKTSAASVAKMMIAHDVHAVVVLGTDHPDRPTMVRDLDVLEAARADALEGLVAADLASPLGTIPGDRTLEQAAAAMLEHGARHLLVLDVDTGHPVGILSTLDVVAAIAGAEVASGPARGRARESW